ncbi:MAG: lytic murein transglycosylase [Xanthobacteraceae bacterium]
MLQRFALILTLATAIVSAHTPAAADPAFDKFLQSLWPAAQSMGVARKTFDAATRGLEPDLSLPDLDIPGRVEKPPAQPEFVQTPAAYVSEASIARFAAQGKRLAAEHRETLKAIEARFGVPGNIILAIWARETSYGGYNLPHNAIRVLATQAYLGQRKDQFRQEFLQALKILEEGHVKLGEMKSSWAGAMGHTQFLPTDFFKYAVDFDGDGHRDIWDSVPDALASTASQLVGKGWQPGRRWAHEVRVPLSVDCSKGEPGFKLPVREWLQRGYVPAYGRKLGAAELAEEASLLMPEGIYGPAFLTPKNYFVLKDYNFSDLYVLFVGHLSDRIADARPFATPWSKVDQLRTAQVEEMQRILTAKGIYKDKIDGKAGMLTRAALGEYQKANGLKLDCWPTAAVLQHMRGKAARN